MPHHSELHADLPQVPESRISHCRDQEDACRQVRKVLLREREWNVFCWALSHIPMASADFLFGAFAHEMVQMFPSDLATFLLPSQHIHVLACTSDVIHFMKKIELLI